MPSDLATVRKEVEGDDANNMEIIAYKVTLTVDVSIMAMETPEGKPYWSVDIGFPPTVNDGDNEDGYEAVASLAYNADENTEITSLDEAIRLLGISPDAQVWESEQ